MPLSVNDKKAIVCIIIILLGFNGSMYLFRRCQSKHGEILIQQDSIITQKDVRTAKEPFKFDPNTADYDTFISLGLRPNVAKAIINYRKAGGVFRKPEDLGKIYTLSDSDYLRLLPYITIRNTQNHRNFTQYNKQRQRYTSDAQRETRPSNTYSYHSYKLHSGQKVDANNSDSTLLQKVPGIGPYYANKIIRYRNRLGGFISTAQLKEINGLPDNIEEWFSITKAQITKLKINRLTFGQLLRHPYLNYEQVVSIFNYRKVYGTIHSAKDLSTYSVFSQDDLKRLEPYLDFSE